MSQEKLPMISVVTPCLNSEKYIAEAVESVLAQDYPSFEHIVVDGGSTDRTLEILKQDPHLKVISEPDEGIYDALNKGISRATGDLIGWLNADDVFAEGAFAAVAEQFVNDPSLELIGGNAEVFDNWGEPASPRVLRSLQFTRQERLGAGFIDQNCTLLNACFIAPRLLEELGRFNPEFKISGDTEFLIRIALHRVHCRVLDRVLYRYRRHAGSFTFSEQRSEYVTLRMGHEGMRVFATYLRERALPPPLQRYCRHGLRRRALLLLRHNARRGKWGAIPPILREILPIDPLWPLWLAWRAARKLFRPRLSAGHSPAPLCNSSAPGQASTMGDQRRARGR